MILPHTRMVAVHAGRRVAAFPRITSKDRRKRLTLMTRDVNQSGIIRLTFTT